MTFRERTRRAEAFRSWPGDMEADYRYTTGVAGERFFVELRDTGRILAARCDACDLAYLPPRIYCENCMGATTDWIPVEGPATVESVTTLHLDERGARLSEPQVWAILRWPGIHGGLVHRLSVPADRAKIGLKVRPVLRPPRDRVGNITDIVHFAP
ncbi:MAG TPA: Zn-ribbon domain-containing OB-fold protein [Thermoplasmata archaeon]|jgi:hypothetical protein|nr:Zn-ribbon domain-containing OB-fold protein [Thermoplasmata archaeon]